MNLQTTTSFTTDFENGQAQFCDSIKTLLYKNDERIFDILDFDNDEIYLEPMLFAYFNSKDSLVPLEQIIFGYIEQAKKPLMIRVYSNEDGVVYLPNFGYLQSNHLNSYLTLKYDKVNGSLNLFDENDLISCNFSPILTLSNVPTIEVCIHSNPLLSEYFNQWKGFVDFRSLKIKETALTQKGLIETAFNILKKSSIEDCDLLIKSTKKIFLFKNPQIRCFVTRSVHGIVFLNVPEILNETFFLEELIHQCSHNVFNAITANTKDYFRVNPSSPLTNFTKKEGETRSLYDAFHGHYTVCKGVEYLTKCIIHLDNEDDKMHELIGRIAIKEKRFRIGLNLVNFEEVFTEKGRETYQLLDNSCVDVIRKHPNIFGKFNFSNQSAVFDYTKFKEVNPINNN